jgi:hypothetical protein
LGDLCALRFFLADFMQVLGVWSFFLADTVRFF